jgi:cob(I)alamin adenosyltransferase
MNGEQRTGNSEVAATAVRKVEGRPRLSRGLVQVYTGDGKGKTTAALGLALRAAGHGLQAIVFCFMKTHDTYGEILGGARFAPEITVRAVGRETFVDRENPAPEDVRMAREGFAQARQAALSGEYDLVVLDEFNIVLDYRLVPVDEVLALFREKPKQVEIVLTGRSAPAAVLEAADLVTEMVERKHYYPKGVYARRGIDY